MGDIHVTPGAVPSDMPISPKSEPTSASVPALFSSTEPNALNEIKPRPRSGGTTEGRPSDAVTAGMQLGFAALSHLSTKIQDVASQAKGAQVHSFATKAKEAANSQQIVFNKQNANYEGAKKPNNEIERLSAHDQMDYGKKMNEVDKARTAAQNAINARQEPKEAVDKFKKLVDEFVKLAGGMKPEKASTPTPEQAEPAKPGALGEVLESIQSDVTALKNDATKLRSTVLNSGPTIPAGMKASLLRKLDFCDNNLNELAAGSNDTRQLKAVTQNLESVRENLKNYGLVADRK